MGPFQIYKVAAAGKEFPELVGCLSIAVIEFCKDFVHGGSRDGTMRKGPPEVPSTAPTHRGSLEFPDIHLQRLRFVSDLIAVSFWSACDHLELHWDKHVALWTRIRKTLRSVYDHRNYNHLHARIGICPCMDQFNPLNLRNWKWHFIWSRVLYSRLQSSMLIGHLKSWSWKGISFGAENCMAGCICKVYDRLHLQFVREAAFAGQFSRFPRTARERSIWFGLKSCRLEEVYIWKASVHGRCLADAHVCTSNMYEQRHVNTGHFNRRC